MIRRVVAIKFKPGISAEEVRAHRRAWFEVAERVPEVRRLRWAAHVPDGEPDPSLDQANLWDFEDMAGVRAFLVAPAHLERARNPSTRFNQSRIVLNYELREPDYEAPDADGRTPRLSRLTLVRLAGSADAAARSEYRNRWVKLARQLPDIKRYSGLPHLSDGQDNANYDWVDLFEFDDLASLVSFLRHPRRAALERDLRSLGFDHQNLNLDIEGAETVDKGL